ncbi:rhomboid family intramembrane serine protease [Salinibacterium sp. ZJ70]|uniref:rhomboid family intramembrane serine protease n=1 Tax=Salinibacterium sp. ZJ70 TaxID=2708084 RepID=UPI00141F91DB|nr:rhomboid family intramembrane serine protease [Salinibacterium sp. ZJ70]
MSTPRFGEMHDADPSVCYRHPDRQSWTLCQRCGRTICPECQILAPVGVQCPECVAEAGGSVAWTPTHTKPVKRKAAARRQSSRQRPQSGFAAKLSQMIRPDGAAPSLSWVFAGAVVALWVLGLLTQNRVHLLLAASPSVSLLDPSVSLQDSSVSLQVWRYATAPFATMASFNFVSILSLAISLFFWLYFAPSVEKSLGRSRFVLIFIASAVFGSAAMVIFGATAFGLGAPLFGLFGAYAVSVWSYPPARNQILIVLALNVAINLAIGGGYSLPYILGGAAAGAGSAYLLSYYAERPRSKPSTPFLIIGAVLAGMIILAIATNL